MEHQGTVLQFIFVLFLQDFFFQCFTWKVQNMCIYNEFLRSKCYHLKTFPLQLMLEHYRKKKRFLILKILGIPDRHILIFWFILINGMLNLKIISLLLTGCIWKLCLCYRQVAWCMYPPKVMQINVKSTFFGKWWN